MRLLTVECEFKSRRTHQFTPMKKKLVAITLRILYNVCKPLWNKVGVKVTDGEISYFCRKNLDVTVWERWDEEYKKWDFNHWDYHRLDAEKPVGNKNWSKGKWRKSYRLLKNGVIFAPIA